MRVKIIIGLCLISILFISGCTNLNPELEKKYCSIIGICNVVVKDVEIPDVIVIDNIKIPALAGGRVKPNRNIDILVTLKNRDVDKPITLTYASISDPGIFTCIDCKKNNETSISPGQLKTFSFTVKSPSNKGTIALPGHLEFSVKYKYRSTRLATITFIGKNDYMDYLESGGKVPVSIINIPSDGPVELNLDISNIHQPVVIDDESIMSSKLQSNENPFDNSDLVNEITDSFIGKIVFAADCSAGDTDWGEAASLGCSGNNRRCFGGNCIECDGKMVNGLCWYEGSNSNENCNQVCSTRNGVYNGNCNWKDNDSCAVCKTFHPTAGCSSGGGIKPAPYYNPSPSCCYSSNDYSDCTATIPAPLYSADSTRICACNGNKIVVCKCSEGTSCNQCTPFKPLYCDSTGTLVHKCKICGCPSDKPNCQSDGSCGSSGGDSDSGSDSDGSGGSGSGGSSSGEGSGSSGGSESSSSSSSSSSYEDKGEHQIYLEVLNKGSGEIDMIGAGNLDISFEDMNLEVCSKEFGGEGCSGTSTSNNENITVRGSNPFRYYFSFTPNPGIIKSDSITATKKVEVSAEYIYRLPQTIDILVSPRAEI